jgi:uncharacterized protein (TIGR03382 family)
MNHLPLRALRTLTVAAVLLAAAGAARADAFAQSILVIDNFRLLHSNGTPFTASDFSLLTGTNNASAGTQFNSVFASGSQTASLFSGIDLAQLQVGTGLPARPENNFTPYAFTPASFGYADQRMAGSMITTDLGVAGAQVQTRADASLAANGSAAGLTNVGTSSAFSFSLGMGECMTIAFSALPFTQAIASGGANATYANAHLSWSISLLDVTTGATVFDFAPEQLNAMADVAGADGALTYSPGWLTFSTTAGMLKPGDLYQITIAQSSYAGALQSQAIPEPGTPAVFGVGLLAMAALLSRRRNRHR